MMNTTRNILQRTGAGGILLGIFVSVLFFSLFTMSTNMGTMSENGGCPFMTESGSLCQMSFADHIASWQILTLATPLLLMILLLIPMYRTLMLRVAEFFDQITHVWELQPNLSAHTTLSFTFIPNYIRESFSGGILHPKLF